MKAWLKGGLVGAIIGIIAIIGSIGARVGCAGGGEWFQGARIPLLCLISLPSLFLLAPIQLPSWMISALLGPKYQIISILISYILLLVFYIVVGFVVYSIFRKIKNKQKSET